ncbi:hypothetical protein LY76DRAFT_267352 [Colletotrichum caudatum]|nr:hypothetical protein LY76DRAFT_267352 [Colletotrichum caudatum]
MKKGDEPKGRHAEAPFGKSPMSSTQPTSSTISPHRLSSPSPAHHLRLAAAARFSSRPRIFPSRVASRQVVNMSSGPSQRDPKSNALISRFEIVVGSIRHQAIAYINHPGLLVVQRGPHLVATFIFETLASPTTMGQLGSSARPTVRPCSSGRGADECQLDNPCRLYRQNLPGATSYNNLWRDLKGRSMPNINGHYAIDYQAYISQHDTR